MSGSSRASTRTWPYPRHRDFEEGASPSATLATSTSGLNDAVVFSSSTHLSDFESSSVGHPPTRASYERKAEIHTIRWYAGCAQLVSGGIT